MELESTGATCHRSLITCSIIHWHWWTECGRRLQIGEDWQGSLRPLPTNNFGTRAFKMELMDRDQVCANNLSFEMWVSAKPSWNTYSPGTRNRRRLSMISKDKAKSERDQNREFLKIADKVAIVWAAGNATSNVGKNGFTDVTDSMAVVRSSTLSLVSTFFTPTVNKITALRPFSSSELANSGTTRDTRQ